MFPQYLKITDVIALNSSKCVVTIALGDCPFIPYTKRLMSSYALKIHADFKIVTSYDKIPSMEVDCTSSDNTLSIVKMNVLHDFLQIYDRVIYLDSTCCVNQQTPDLFEVVKYDELGGQQEGLLTYMTTYTNDYNFTKEKLDYKLDRSTYIGTGLLVVSKKHQSLFDNRSINENYIFFQADYPQQGYINYLIQKNHIKVKLLNVKWNNPRVFRNRFLGEQISQLILDSNYINENYIMFVTDYYLHQLYYVQQICEIYSIPRYFLKTQNQMKC